MDIHRLPDRIVKIVNLLAMAALPIGVAAKDIRSMQFAGYKAVPVHYGPLNKMIMSVNVNGQPANLLIDTGATQTMLVADAAESFGVTPSPRGLRYIGYTRLNGQLCPIAFVRSLTAGNMNFGSTPVTLLNSGARSSFANRMANGTARVDGMLGTEILVRHKAVINSRTKLIFFKVNASEPLQLAAIASSEKFTRVPLRREENGAFTVSGSIHGERGRLFVDTGAFVTTFNQGLLKSLGMALQPAHISGRFSDGVSRQYSVGQVNDLTIGDFKVPPAKFGVAALPNFATREGNAQIDGILGMDLLFDCHAIIDFGSMNLFLK
jgi:predicted aspartyl protease